MEEDCQVEDQFGLDYRQVRLYTTMLHHLILAMTAPAICAATTAAMPDATSTPPSAPVSPDQPPQHPGLIPLTAAEIKRLLHLLTQTRHELIRRLHWAWWRRRHQARALRFQQRT